ncbi:MAG TPA: hypothetical protein VIV65_06380 [Gemmatimonadaceae bacterium]
MNTTRTIAVAALLVSGCTRTAPAPITSGSGLISAMHDRYARDMYHTLSFVQKSTYLKEDGSPSRVETWYESLQFPGKLRIDLGEPAKGNGVLYRHDSTYQLQAGKITDRRAGRNPLLVLGFDVYAQSPSTSLAQLDAEHIAVGAFHVDTLGGVPMYVVGAARGDLTSKQFWVDARDLLFRRLIDYNAARKLTSDIRFEEYKPYGKAWVSERVRVYRDGKQVFQEDYSDVRVNPPLDANLFIPEKWSIAKHWYTP